MRARGTTEQVVITILAGILLVLGSEVRALTVSGEVTVRRAEPLSGATVTLLPLEIPAETIGIAAGLPRPQARVKTTEDGRFRLTIEQADFYVLRIEAPGFVPAEHRLVPLIEDLLLPPVELALDAGLWIRVMDPSGRPSAQTHVAGFPIYRENQAAKGWRQAPRSKLTDKEGIVHLPWSKGEELTVQAFRFDLGISIQVVASADSKDSKQEQALTLELAASRRRVLRALNGEGKPQSGLIAYSGDGRWRLGQTDSDGKVTVSITPGRQAQVDLYAADGRRGTVRINGDEDNPVTVEVMAPGRYLTGRLTSADTGLAIPDGLIWPADEPYPFARSDTDGRFVLALREENSGAIKAAAEGFVPKLLETPLRQGSPQNIFLDPSISLAGTIVEPSGRPIGGAEIEVFPLAAPLRVAARSFSDAEGKFRLPALPANGGYRVEVQHEGYESARQEVSARRDSKEPAHLHFILRSGRTAFGVVRNREAEPIRAARVSLVSQGNEAIRLPAVLSDQKGNFHFKAVPPGSFILSVQASGFAPLTLPGISIPAGAEPWDLGTAFLEPGATIEGRVIEKDGAAVPGARVRILSEEAEKGRRPSPEADIQVTTDEDGRFTLRDQPAGSPCRLEVSAAGFIPTLTPQVMSPTAEPITIVLQPSCRLSGTVLTGGGPAAGAVVVAEIADGSPSGGRRFYTTGDAEGNFLLQDVEPGNLILSASTESYGESDHVPLTLSAGELREGLEIHLKTGGSVSGTVSSRPGIPLEGAAIEAFSEDGGPSGTAPSRRTAVSDRSGRFQLKGLRSGSWLFRASHAKFARKVARQRIGDGDHPLNFVLESGSEIAGTVTDESGTPVPGAQIVLSQRAGGGLLPSPPARQLASQADGSFRFTGIEDGSYHLRASKAGFAPAEPAEPIALASEPVEGTVLLLVRASSISGRLLGLPYSQLARVEVYAFQADGQSVRGEVEPTGAYRVGDLAPGPWHLVAEVEETGKRAIGQVLVGEEPARLDLDFASEAPFERSGDDRGNP